MSRSTSASATPPLEQRDAPLLSVGHQCSDPSCSLVDFLPFKCQHCTQPFCGEHYLPTAHKCAKYDVTKHDRVAPSCPLCNTPVAIPLGEDPNIRMERHINSECSVMTGRSKAKSSPICARAKCGKLLFAPIRCDKCNQQFCPSHRFPNTHACTSVTAPPSKNSKQPASSTTNPLAGLPAQTSAASAAALAAIKRSLTSGSASASASNHVSSSGPASSRQTVPIASASKSTPAAFSNPFSKVDRRLSSMSSSSSSTFGFADAT